MKIKRLSDKVRNYRMRIKHISDNHGQLPKLHGRYDAVVNSGDFLPNTTALYSGNKVQEAVNQINWIIDNAEKLKQWLNGNPFLFTLGNHDFCSAEMVEKTLQECGIDAISLHDKPIMHEGVMFYGFPYVPTIDGSWNFEREISEMQQEVDIMLDTINKVKIDVLVAHSCIYNCLDLTLGNQHMGSTIIANALNYKIEKDMLPKYYLHGHCHEANGMAIYNEILVSNAATTQQTVEVI